MAGRATTRIHALLNALPRHRLVVGAVAAVSVIALVATTLVVRSGGGRKSGPTSQVAADAAPGAAEEGTVTPVPLDGHVSEQSSTPTTRAGSSSRGSASRTAATSGSGPSKDSAGGQHLSPLPPGAIAYPIGNDVVAMAADGTSSRTLTTARGYVPDTWSPDGSLLAAVSPQSGPSGELDVVIVDSTDHLVRKLPGAGRHVVWSPDGSMVATVNAMGADHFSTHIRVFDVRSGRLVHDITSFWVLLATSHP